MKNLLIAVILTATLPMAAVSQRNIYHFGPEREHPRLDRKGRYADSARIYMLLMLKAKTMDSASYYDAAMHYHRHMESWRQDVVKDSAWKAEFNQKVHGWRPYRSGKQVASAISDAVLRNMFLYLNTADNYWSCPGEYLPVDVDPVTGTVYSHTGSGVPTVVPGSPANGATPVGGPHNGCVLTANGQVWCYGQWVPTGATGMSSGSSSMVQVTTDSLGNYLDSVSQMFLSGTNYGNFWNGGFVTTTGKGYVIGELESGIEGNGTWGNPWAPKPVQVTLPGGRKFKKIQGGYFILALATDGTVWTWGGGGNTFWLMQGNSPTWMTPGQVTLPAGYTATDIASNGVFSVIVCNDASGNQHLWGGAQQYYDDYVGFPTGSGRLTSSAQDLSNNFYPKLPAAEQSRKIAHVFVNSNATYFIMDNGQLYGWGSSPCGELGIGLILNFAVSGPGNTPYFWGFGPHYAMQTTPARIMPGVHNIMTILNCLSNSFYITVIDSAGNSYSAGRNKGQAQMVSLPQDSSTSIVNANPVAGYQGSQLPDSWNEKYMTPNHGNRVSKGQQVASPYCILNPNDQSKCGNPANGTSFSNPPHGTITGNLSATASNGTITVSAAGKTATNGLVIMRMEWSQLDSTTAPSLLDIPYRNINTAVISSAQDAAIHSGTYNIGWMGITNASDTLHDSIQIVVNVQGPTVNAGNPQFIYLPQTTATLSGTASGQGGASISSYAWTQLQGPNTATIASANAATTGISGLILGTYQFQLTVVDSGGNSASATVTVTVTQAGVMTVPLPVIFKTH